MKIAAPATKSSEESKVGGQRLVALLTDNAVLQIDIQDALESVGYGVWIAASQRRRSPKRTEPGTLSAAIIDLGSGDSSARKLLEKLSLRGIPAFVIGTNADVLDDAKQFPNVLEFIEMPFCIDAFLPNLADAANS